LLEAEVVGVYQRQDCILRYVIKGNRKIPIIG